MEFIKTWFMRVLVMLLAIVNLRLVYGQEPQPQVPCFFIFGDSLVDNGNNNLLVTKAKANYPPYGVDFPAGPTGRFTNGKNIADVLAELLGFPTSIPPFASATGQAILKGVNYGSGSAGIRDETGQQLGDRISLNRQLLNHGLTVSRIQGLFKGDPKLTRQLLSQCLYIVDIGSNDYLNNYLMPLNYPTSRQYTPDRYAAALIQQYSGQLTTLYNYGARKIAIFGIGLIGCTPELLSMAPPNASPCVDSANSDVQLFNNMLKPLVDQLNIKLPGAKFTYINSVSISSGDPTSLSITVLNKPCCVVSRATAGQCVPGQPPCIDRTKYAFFDNFHPTEVATVPTARRAYHSLLPEDAYPLDIHHLVLS